MDDYQATARRERMRDIRGPAVAFLMLGISLFALYTHTFHLVIIPLLWMAFRAGKEQGREQAHKEIEEARTGGTVLWLDHGEQGPHCVGRSSSHLHRP